MNRGSLGKAALFLATSLLLSLLSAQTAVASLGDSWTVGNTDQSWWDNTSGLGDNALTTIHGGQLRLTGENAVGWWNFDWDENTIVHDLTSHNNDGTSSGPNFVSGHSGAALDFDGTGDYVEVPDSASLDITSAITMIAWINPDTLPSGSYRDIVSKELSYRVVIDGNGKYKSYIYGGPAGWNLSASSVSTSTWQMLAVTYDGSNVRHYLNGVEDGNSPFSRSGDIQTGSYDLQFGILTGNSNKYDGLIDEVRIYDRALTASEISTLYNGGSVTNNLVSYWSFDDGTANDQAGTNDGTLNGPNLVSGQFDNALDFDGTDDYIDIPDWDWATTMDWAVTAWIKTTDSVYNTSAIAVEGPVLGDSAATRRGEIGVDDGRVAYEYYNGSGHEVHGTGIVTDGNWHFLAWVNHNNSTIDLYVDGEAEVTGATSGPVDDEAKFVAREIGGAYNRTFDGIIDEVCIFDRALSENEIKRHYNQTAPHDNIETGEWRSKWHDFGSLRGIGSIDVSASIAPGESASATVSINNSPHWDGTEENVNIDLSDGNNNYSIGKPGRYIALTFNLSTTDGSTAHSPSIDNFTVNLAGLPVITSVTADSSLIDRDIDYSGSSADDIVDIVVRAEIDGPAAVLDNALFSIRDNTDTEVISWAKVSETSASGDNWKEWTYQYNPDDATSDEALGAFDARVKVVSSYGGQDNTLYTDTDPGGFELFAVDDLSASITLSDPTPRVDLQVSGSASRISGATSLDNAWAVDNSFGEQTMSLEGDSYNLTYQVDSLGGGASASVYVLVSDDPLDGVSTTLSYTVVNQVPIVSNLKTEGLTNPTKVTTPTPTFTWSFGDADGDSQQGIHIQVGISEGASGLWDYQDTTMTAQSIQYAGLALERGITYHVRARARDNFGEWAEWDNGDSGTFALNRIPVVDNLKTEGLVNPQNLTDYIPNFSWGYSDGDGDVQSHYQVWVGTSEGANDMWDSGAVASSTTSVDYDGDPLQNGAKYYLQIRTKDGAEWGGWTMGTFRINAPPVAQSVRINGDNNYTNSRSVTLAISATDDVSVENMQFSFDGSTWTAWESYSTSKSLTLPENEGVHRVYFKVCDGQDWESDVISDTIILDLTKPYGMVGTSPIDNAVVGPITVRFCWTLARDNISGVVSTYTFELAKNSEFTQDLYVATSYKDYVDFPYDNREGASYWRVRVRDRAGNENVTPTYRFIYNPDAPSLTVAAEKTILNTLSASITLSGSNVSAYRYALTEADLDDADWVSYTGAESTLAIGLPAEEGQYRIYFEARSEAGVTAGPFAVPILLDFTPPQLTLTVDNLASENSVRTLGLTGDDGTGSGISQMRIKIGTDNWGPWENYSETRVVELEGEGVTEVQVQLRDLAGNVSAARSLSLFWSTSPPELDLPEVPAEADGGTYVLRVPASPGVSLFVDGEEVEVDENGYFVAELRLREGRNEFVITARDLAGHITEETITITWAEAAPPSVSGFPLWAVVAVGCAAGVAGVILVLRKRSGRYEAELKRRRIKPKAVKPFVEPKRPKVSVKRRGRPVRPFAGKKKRRGRKK